MSFDPTSLTGDEYSNAPVNSLITPAKYHLEVVAAEERTSKAGHMYYSVQFRVADDQPHSNRRVFQAFNFNHPNEKVSDIAKKQLSALIKAGGRISGCEDLVGRHVVGAVGIKKGQGDWPDSNDIKFFDQYDGYKCPPHDDLPVSSHTPPPAVDDIF